MINVLVVDDSAVVRETMGMLLSKEGMNVVAAGDPLIARQKMRSFEPDVVLLDLEMPRMDGITFLRWLMAEKPLPVVVCSGLAAPGTEIALTALEEGAVDIITKPSHGVGGFLHEYRVRLARTIRGAANAHPRKPVRNVRTAAPPRLALKLTSDKVVAVGASTGGTEALKTLLQAMPPDAPGIVVVQHMPELFTRAFAMRLNDCSAVEVAEAQDGQRITPGLALIAPGNRHLSVHRSGAHYIAALSDGPPVSRHRPSVDVLFKSMAQAAGPNGVGVIMTGMGADGADGLREMRSAGAHTIAQDEASCVVFGMPKEAIHRGAVAEVVPLDEIGAAILRASAAPDPRAR